jgi:transcription initiation factor IIE alpha subunit
MSEFYNTNREEGEELLLSNKVVRKQTDTIYKHFQDNPKGDYTAEDINNQLLKNGLRTSIRRALTDLEEEGKIIFVGQRRSKDTRKKISIYKLNPAPHSLIHRQSIRKEMLRLLNKCKESILTAMKSKTNVIGLHTQVDFNELVEEIKNLKKYKIKI